MSTNGHLKFQGTNRATFVGATSNIMFDTTSTSLGIGVTGTDHPSSNLYITGNAYVTSDIGVGGVLTMGTVNVVARHDLESVTATGNTTPLTVEFQNTDTSLVASGNVEVAKELTVAGNATVSSNLTVSGNVEVGTANLFVDTVNSRVGVGTTNPNVLLELSSDTGSATIVPTELRLSSSTNATDWDTTNPYARLAFYTEDVTADAPGVMASIGAVASSVDGGENTRLAFFTAEPHDERMCIDRYGNVGVGTSSPDGPLHLFKSAAGTGDTGPGILFTRYSNTYGGCIWNESNGSEDGLYFNAFTNSAVSNEYGGTPAMVINSNRHVGIGTTSPSFPLSVSDASVKQWNAFNNNTSAGDYTFTKSGIYLVGFMYGDGADGNTCEYYTITAATSHGVSCGVTKHKDSAYLNYAVQDHDTVRFWSGSPSSTLPAAFNSSNFHLRIYFAGYF